MRKGSNKPALNAQALATDETVQPSHAEVQTDRPRQGMLLIGLLLLIAVVVGIRLRLLGLPLERDEGEYAYAGQLLLQGVPPYQALYSMKWPGTFVAYAAIMGIFGQTTSGIHFGLLLVTLANDALVFLLARRICGTPGGLAAAASFALLSIAPYSFGLAAHATQFVLLPALAGILLIQDLDERTSLKRIFVAGLLLGLAALMKQAGAAFGLFGATWVVVPELMADDRSDLPAPRRDARIQGGSSRNKTTALQDGRWPRVVRRLAVLAVGGLLPLAVAGLVLAMAGAWQNFWLWTFKYSRSYVEMNGIGTALHWLAYHGGRIVTATTGLWVLAAAGVVFLWSEPSLRHWRLFVPGFLLFSVLSLCPGGYFRGHYFLLLFPVLGLLCGISVYGLAKLAQRQLWPSWTGAVPGLLFAAAALWSLYSASDVFFKLDTNSVSRKLYALNPFPESVEIGRYLQAHCEPGARIAVMGSEPQLYFYSRRRAATGFIYMYPLTERHPYAETMQEELRREIIENRPEYVVFISQPSSWLSQPNSDPSPVQWFIDYQREQLELVALVDILKDGTARYYWSQPPAPASDQWIQIYRRKDPARS